MSLKLTNILIAIITMITMGFVAFTVITPFAPHKFIYQGVVDNEKTYDKIENVKMENKFLAWEKTAKSFGEELDNIVARKRLPIITIEPWGLIPEEPYTFANLEGPVYRDAIVRICDAIEARGQKVTLRWGHEMEQVGSRYPWASYDSEGFKKAYKFWVDTCRSRTKLVDFMWSPAGKANLVDYYPGNEYVDNIGLSTFGNPEYELKLFGKKLTFEDLFNERYGRVAKYGKDIYIAEFGVAGDAQYQTKWMTQAKKAILDPLKYPNLRGVIYFHGGDGNPWVEGTTPPNFRLLTPNQFPFAS